MKQKSRPLRADSDLHCSSWRGQDLNLRPSGYEPDELPDCSTPRCVNNSSGSRATTPQHHKFPPEPLDDCRYVLDFFVGTVVEVVVVDEDVPDVLVEPGSAFNANWRSRSMAFTFDW